MSPTYVVTGATSGIGGATSDLLEERGANILRCDLQGGDIQADISDRAGRRKLITEVERLSGGRVDGVVLCAGTATMTATDISVNYFATTEILDALRPLLSKADSPRAVVITSNSVILTVNQSIIDACLAHDEEAARAAATAIEGDRAVYASSKLALHLACRRRAAQAQWGGEGILLNCVAPGLVDTPMLRSRLPDPAAAERMKMALPSAIGRYGEAREIAEAVAFLVSPANSIMVGQQILLDCGTDAILRPEHF